MSALYMLIQNASLSSWFNCCGHTDSNCHARPLSLQVRPTTGRGGRGGEGRGGEGRGGDQEERVTGLQGAARWTLRTKSCYSGRQECRHARRQAGRQADTENQRYKAFLCTQPSDRHRMKRKGIEVEEVRLLHSHKDKRACSHSCSPPVNTATVPPSHKRTSVHGPSFSPYCPPFFSPFRHPPLHHPLSQPLLPSHRNLAIVFAWPVTTSSTSSGNVTCT